MVSSAKRSYSSKMYTHLHGGNVVCANDAQVPAGNDLSHSDLQASQSGQQGFMRWRQGMRAPTECEPIIVLVEGSATADGLIALPSNRLAKRP